MKDAPGSRRPLRATRVIAATAGALCGLSGLEHGLFETLQGPVAPQSLLISAIGPAQRFWPGGTETALTVVPNIFVTGILAMLASALVILCSAAFVQRKHGALLFLLLSVAQFLVGGGFAQILLVPLVAAAASQIGRPLGWLRALLPASARQVVGCLWGWLLAGFALTFCGAIYAAILGVIPVLSGLFALEGSRMTGVLYGLGYGMLGLLALAILSGLAHDSAH
jgi:hypothetical protein